MAEVDFSAPKPGYKREIHDSPRCTLCEAKWHQWCNHTDIMPHDKFGTGWKNVGEKGCEVGKCRAICGKDFNINNREQCCLGNETNPLQNCHMEWKDCNSEECFQTIKHAVEQMLITGNLNVAPNVSKWMNDSKNNGKFEEIKRAICSAHGGKVGKNTICDIWCNTHPKECHQSRMKACTEGNIGSETCQNWKDVAKNQNLDITTYINAEEKYCTSSLDNMRSQRCVKWATDPSILQVSRSTKLNYDMKWVDFCDSVHNYKDKKPQKLVWAPKDNNDLELAEKQCSCSLPPGVKPGDLTTLLSNPYCFNGVCMSREESYRFISGMDDKRQCPNVCSSIIQNNAGNTGIIRNVNVIQNCFNAQGQSDVKNVIKAQIEKELKVNITNMLKTYIITETDYSATFKDFIEKNKPDLEAYTTAVVELNYVTNGKSKYIDMDSYAPYIGATELKSELKYTIPTLRQMYVDIVSMEWPANESPEKLAEKYAEMTDKFAVALQGRTNAMLRYIEDVKNIKTYFNELIQERKTMIEQLKNGLKEVESENKELKLSIPHKLQNVELKDKDKTDLSDLMGRVDSLIKGVNLDFTENVISNAFLRTKVAEFDGIYRSIRMAVNAVNNKANEILGGSEAERVTRIKQEVRHEMQKLTTSYVRVSNLGKDGKLSSRDKDSYIGFSNKRKELEQRFIEFEAKTDLKTVTSEKDSILLEVHGLIPKLDAIIEFKEPVITPPPPVRKEPNTQLPPPVNGDEPANGNIMYIVFAILAVVFIGLLVYKLH